MLSERVVENAQDPTSEGGGWAVLQVECSRLDAGTLLLRLEGDLDAYSTRELSNHLREAEAGASNILIDLSRLRFIDCAGVHQLVEAGQRAKGRGGRLKLVRGPQQVHRVFALTGLESAFEFVPAADS